MVCFGYTSVFVAYRGDTNSFVDRITTDVRVLSTPFFIFCINCNCLKINNLEQTTYAIFAQLIDIQQLITF